MTASLRTIDSIAPSMAVRTLQQSTEERIRGSLASHTGIRDKARGSESLAQVSSRFLCVTWLGRVCQDGEMAARMEGLITNLLKRWTISPVVFAPRFSESPTLLSAVASTTVAAVLTTGRRHKLSPPGVCTAVKLLTSAISWTRKWNGRSSHCMYCVFMAKMAVSGREN